MGTNDSSTGEGVGSSPGIRPLPEFVDWIAAAIVALAGAALTVGGSALTFVVGRDMLEEGVESGRITVVMVERELTEVEMLEFTLEVISWTGLGLLVTGIGLILFAIGYVIVRHRSHQQASNGEPAGSYRSYAVLGAVITAVLSFLPFAPVLGGGTAGYLEQYGTGRSTSAGALSGFLAMLPVLVLLVFVTVGIYTGFAAIGDPGFGIVATAAMLFTSLFVGAYGVGLGALAGFVGGRLAES